VEISSLDPWTVKVIEVSAKHKTKTEFISRDFIYVKENKVILFHMELNVPARLNAFQADVTGKMRVRSTNDLRALIHPQNRKSDTSIVI
jgi:hypothetical protein